MSEPNEPHIRIVLGTPENQSLPCAQPRSEPLPFVRCAPGLGRRPAANDLLAFTTCHSMCDLTIRGTE